MTSIKTWLFIFVFSMSELFKIFNLLKAPNFSDKANFVSVKRPPFLQRLKWGDLQIRTGGNASSISFLSGGPSNFESCNHDGLCPLEMTQPDFVGQSRTHLYVGWLHAESGNLGICYLCTIQMRCNPCHETRENGKQIGTWRKNAIMS